MTMRKFEFKKTYEEIDVAGKVYQIDFSDEKLREYRESFKSFKTDYEKLLAMDESKMSEEEALDHFEQIQELVKRMLETILGKGTYTPLYEASGRSIMNMFDFIKYLGEVVAEKSSRNVVDKSAQYLKKKQQARKK
jgi:hypothetical protein